MVDEQGVTHFLGGLQPIHLVIFFGREIARTPMRTSSMGLQPCAGESLAGADYDFYLVGGAPLLCLRPVVALRLARPCSAGCAVELDDSCIVAITNSSIQRF
jgi:hypothetical protein